MIDELVYQNDFMADDNILYRHINLGSEFVIDKNLINSQQISQGFVFDDQDTVNFNAVHSNGKNIYAGRSDGVVLSGDRRIWRSRKDFSNPQEFNFIKYKKMASDSVVNVSNGELRVFKSTVRIS